MSIVTDFLDSCSPALERLSRTNPELAESTFRVLIACTQLEAELKPKQTISDIQKKQLEQTCLLFTGSFVNPAQVSQSMLQVTKEQEKKAEEKAEEMKKKLVEIVGDDVELNEEALVVGLPYIITPDSESTSSEIESDDLGLGDLNLEGIDVDNIDVEDIDVEELNLDDIKIDDIKIDDINLDDIDFS